MSKPTSVANGRPYLLPKNIRDKIEEILGKHIFKISKEDALMQAATMVLDTAEELQRAKVLLEAVRGEIRTLVAIQLKQRGIERLVLTRQEFAEIPPDVDVHCSAPEPGVRVYELRPIPPATDSRIATL